MKDIAELDLGYGDAENYKRRENKQLFNRIFVKGHQLDQLVQDHVFFLMGEKGTGKTAFAVYLTNNTHHNVSSMLTYIRETEYQKFVTMRKEKHLLLTDYANIWKVIIFLLLAEKLSADPKEKSILNISKFKSIRRAVDDYYANAFSPEIVTAMHFIDRSNEAAKLIAKYVEIGVEHSSEISFSESRFQINLMYINRKFQEAFESIKLNNSHVLFIDGIDIRPGSIAYEDYLACIKGLANAIWELNNDFFSAIKDSPGRLRVVLLVRPDIFQTLSLQNQSNKVSDNSILLDWRTTYNEYRSSPLFAVADRLLAAPQSENLELGNAWDHYFPYQIHSSAPGRTFDHSFTSFLRFSLYRPRDIVSMLRILQENVGLTGKHDAKVFSKSDFDHPSFRNKQSTYLLGEVKDQLCFYYSPEHYELFLKFFQFLKGATKFSYAEFAQAFGEVKTFLDENDYEHPDFFKSQGMFLQFLYELNVISYIEDPVEYNHGPFIRWCFRERTPSNFSPKVRLGVRYEIHYGLAKSLRMGMEVR